MFGNGVLADGNLFLAFLSFLPALRTAPEVGLQWEHKPHSLSFDFIWLFFYILWEFCTMWFDCIYPFPQLFTDLSLLPSPSSSVSFIFIHSKSILCCPYICGSVAIHWNTVNLSGATLLKRTVSLPTLSITNCSAARGGASCAVPLYILGFGLSWGCTGPMHAVTTALSSCV